MLASQGHLEERTIRNLIGARDESNRKQCQPSEDPENGYSARPSDNTHHKAVVRRNYGVFTSLHCRHRRAVLHFRIDNEGAPEHAADFEREESLQTSAQTHR